MSFSLYSSTEPKSQGPKAELVAVHRPRGYERSLFNRLVIQFHPLCICSLPPKSILKVPSSIPSGHTVVHVKQKMHSVERTLSPLFKYSMILMSIGHALLHAPHCVHFSLSPSILRKANLDVTLSIATIGQSVCLKVSFYLEVIHIGQFQYQRQFQYNQN
jgi:hypothetical protein